MMETVEKRQALLASLVADAEPNKWYNIEYLKHHLKQFKFELRDGEFLWCGERSYENSGMVGWSHPTRGQYVIFHKTLKGCKNSFLKIHNTEWSFVHEI